VSRLPTPPLARLLAGLLVLVALLVGPASPRAYAAEAVASYAVQGSIDPDGTLSVEATIAFEGPAPASLVQKFATTREVVGDREYVFQLSDIRATVGGCAHEGCPNAGGGAFQPACAGCAGQPCG